MSDRWSALERGDRFIAHDQFGCHRREQGGHDETWLSSRFGNEHHGREWNAIAGAEECSHAEQHVERRVEGVDDVANTTTDDGTTDDERDKHTADTTASQRCRSRHTANEEDGNEKPDGVRFSQPAEDLVARPEREAFAGEPPSDHEQHGQRGAGHHETGDDRPQRERLGQPNQAGESASAECAADSNEHSTRKVLVLERNSAVGVEREDWTRAAERHEHEVARC